MKLRRREFIQLTSAGLAAGAMVGFGGCGDPPEQLDLRYLTPDESRQLSAIADFVLAGSAAMGAAFYVDNLLGAFDVDPPTIFAGGPSSGRNPIPDLATGEATAQFPPNGFTQFVPLPAGHELAWRIRLFGSEAVEGGNFNTEAIGPIKGLRDIYRDGLAALDAESQVRFSKNFLDVDSESQLALWEHIEAIEADFGEAVVNHVLEASYSAPEYGGNTDLSGWIDIKFDGDSMPRGFSIYSNDLGRFVEDAERPVSTPNPDEDYSGFSDETLEFLEMITTFAGGERFF